MSIPPFPRAGPARRSASIRGPHMISRSGRNIEGRLYIWPPSIPGKHENDSLASLRQHPWKCWSSIWKRKVDSHLAAPKNTPPPPPVPPELPGFLPEPPLCERRRREAKLPLCHDSD